MQQDIIFGEKRPLKKSKLQDDLPSQTNVINGQIHEYGQIQVGRVFSKVSSKDITDEIDEGNEEPVEGNGFGRDVVSSSAVCA